MACTIYTGLGTPVGQLVLGETARGQHLPACPCPVAIHHDVYTGILRWSGLVEDPAVLAAIANAAATNGPTSAGATVTLTGVFPHAGTIQTCHYHYLLTGETADGRGVLYALAIDGGTLVLQATLEFDMPLRRCYATVMSDRIVVVLPHHAEETPVAWVSGTCASALLYPGEVLHTPAEPVPFKLAALTQPPRLAPNRMGDERTQRPVTASAATTAAATGRPTTAATLRYHTPLMPLLIAPAPPVQ